MRFPVKACRRFLRLEFDHVVVLNAPGFLVPWCQSSGILWSACYKCPHASRSIGPPINGAQSYQRVSPHRDVCEGLMLHVRREFASCRLCMSAGVSCMSCEQSVCECFGRSNECRRPITQATTHDTCAQCPAASTALPGVN